MGTTRRWAATLWPSMLALLAASAWAAPGDLDVGFGRGGVQITNFGWNSFGGGQATSVLVQPDGKIVAGGVGFDEGTDTLALVRYLPDGSLDQTFGDGGRVLTLVDDPLDPLDGGAVGLVRQLDGKLVVAGVSMTPDFATIETVLVRYHADGTLDRDFGVDGLARVSNGSWLEPHALAAQADGKLLVAGLLQTFDHQSPFVARLDPNGSLDTTFGNAGIAAPPLEDADASAMTIQRDGKVVIAGTDYSANPFRLFLARFDTDGRVDTEFGVGGVMPCAAPQNSEAFALIEQSDGRLVAAGRAPNDGITSKLLIVRHESTGAIDASFGVNGVVSTLAGQHGADARAVVQLGDGRLVVGGWAGGHAAVLQFLADGSLDLTFGQGGVTLVEDEAINHAFYALARQEDGRLVAAGSLLQGVGVTRLEADGALDATFGNGGTASASAGSNNDVLADLIVLRDGNLVAAGTTGEGLISDIGLARYHADGTLDPTFGISGKVITDLGHENDAAVGVVEQADGKLVVGGRTGDDRWVLVRYLPDGSLDPTFGLGGVVRTAVPLYDTPYTMLQQADGRLVLVGSTDLGFMLVRHHPDGAIDTTFGNAGTAVGGGTYGWSVIQQADGKLVVGGTSDDWWDGAFSAARFLPSGVLDPTFDRDGVVFLYESSIERNFFRSLTQRADGKLLGVGGNGIVRLDATGRRERVATAPIRHEAVLELADGSILAAGGTGMNEYLSSQFALAHYTNDGALDTSFGENGRVVTNLGGWNTWIKKLRPHGPGAVLAAGVRGSDFAIARYVVSACANGVIVPDEQCTDGNPCTQDSCTPGGCVHTPAPRTQCRAAGRSQLTLKGSADDTRDQLVWKWSRGEETSVATLGDPTDATSYHLCLYAGGAASSVDIPAGAGWQRAGTTSLRFRATPLSTGAARNVVVKSGTAGKPKASVKASGAALPDVVQPGSALPVTVQLVNDAGLCLGSTYLTAQRNDAQQLMARTP